MRTLYKLALLALISFTACKPEPITPKGLFINEVLSSNSGFGVDKIELKHSDWIEIFNGFEEAKDLSGYSIKKKDSKKVTWKFPDNTNIEAKGRLIIWADQLDTLLHANFKLKSKKTTLYIISPKGDVVDSVYYKKNKFPNVSYGRKSDGEDSWVYFRTPSFDETNSSQKGAKKQKKNEKPTFSHESGFFEGDISLEINSKDGGTIKYTTDGSLPNINSLEYDGPIDLDETTVIRATVFDGDKLASDVVSGTYFFDEDIKLPVVSLSCNDTELWDSTGGIYLNCLKKVKRFGNFEYLVDGKSVLNQDVDFNLHGNIAIKHPQKAFKITANEKYGVGSFEYKFFDNKEVNSMSSFLLRSGGHADNFYTQFRDELGQHLHVGYTEMDFQGSRPVVVFLNGVFWGIYNLKEKLNAEYITSNYGLKEGEFDMLEQSWLEVKSGDKKNYEAMFNFIKDCSVTQENYDSIKTKMDVTNFIDYNIVEIYAANLDWPNWNIKFWRERKDSALWRWIITDLDYGFGEGCRVHYNFIEYVTSPVEIRNTNPPKSTMLLRKLLEFKEFREEFIQKMAVSLNVIYNSKRVLSRIEREKGLRNKQMPREIEKWGGKPFHSKWGVFKMVDSMEKWDEKINVLRDFARKRPNIIRKNLTKKFELDSLVKVKAFSKSGEVSINSITIPKETHEGVYFSNIPLRFNAEPKDGKTFSHWLLNSNTILEKELIYTPTGNIIIEAVFK